MKKLTEHFTKKELARLAKLAGSSYNSLRQVGATRGVSAQMAIRIERAAKKMGRDVRREDLNPGCAVCEFAKKCRKEKS